MREECVSPLKAYAYYFNIVCITNGGEYENHP